MSVIETPARQAAPNPKQPLSPRPTFGLDHLPASQALTTHELEARKLIHRDDSVRECADAFRQIRTRLLALGDDQPFVTLVVPVSPHSGASFVARNLATAFAFSETTAALLIDCNLNHPAQEKAFAIDANQGGLIDYVENPARSIDEVVYNTGVPRLRLIPAGRPQEMHGEHFSSLRMRTLIDSLRSRFDNRYLILDGPAIKAAPDARILSQLADFVVVVAGYGRDTPAAIAKASDQFDPHKLAGVVFNNQP